MYLGQKNPFNRWYRGRFRGRICPWFCRRVRHSGRGALRRCRRECCCRVVREQGNFSPTPCASDLATTAETTRKIRCSDAWLFSARVPLSRLLGVRPDSLRTHHLFLSSLTCVCQFPFHMKELSSKARVSLPHRYGARRSCFPGRVAVRSTRGRGEGSRRGPGRWHCAHSEGLGRPLELVRRALVIRFPFLCMSQSIHPT